MLRFVFCVFAAIIAGFGGATVLGLATAALNHKPYDPNVPLARPGLNKVLEDNPAIVAATLIGFAGGAGTIVWLFISTKPSKKDPEETGPEARSEV